MSCLALHSHRNLELDSTRRNHAYSISLNGGIVIDLQSHGSGDLDRGHEGTAGTGFGVRDVFFHNLKLGEIFVIVSCVCSLADCHSKIPGWGPGTVSAAPRPSSSTCRCTRHICRTSGGAARSRSGRRAPRPSMRQRDLPIPAMEANHFLWINSAPLRFELLIMHAGYAAKKRASEAEWSSKVGEKAEHIFRNNLHSCTIGVEFYTISNLSRS